MNQSRKRMLRREALQSSTAALTAAALIGGQESSQTLGGTPDSTEFAQGSTEIIARENAQPGARDWQLTRVRLDAKHALRCPAIEGYCSKQSVIAGDRLDIMVSTNPTQRFIVEIFRTGSTAEKVPA